MSAEVTIALGVAGRVLANIACANNLRLAAGLVGLSNGFLIHHAWIANTLLDPFTLLVLAAGIVFDHKMYGGFFESAVTEVLACGLGVVLADFGPDLWYEIVGESFGKEVSRELDALGLGMFAGDSYDSASDVDDRSDAGSVSVASRPSRRTSRSARTGASVTVRPSRPRATPHPESTITRLSRVTFDESSITQSQASDADANEDWLTTTNGDALSGSGGADDLYMEPSTTSTSSRMTAIAMRPQTTRRPSILRRLHIPGQETAIGTTLPSIPTTPSQTSSSSTHARLTSDGETTPRATTRPPDFTPLSPPSGFEPTPSGPSFPEPDLTSSTTTNDGYSHDSYTYSPQIIPPSEPTPDLSTSIALPEPMYLPNPFPEPTLASAVREESQFGVSPPEERREDKGPSTFEQMMNVSIVPPTLDEKRHDRDENEHMGSPESRKPSASKRSRSRSRSKSPAPAGPRPQPPSPERGSPPPSYPAATTSGFPSFMSETFDDSTVDVGDVARDAAIERIEEAWKHVEKKKQRRLNVLVSHDDDEFQSSARKNSTFHLMEELENLRFNFKIRPGIIIITSRSRG